MRLIDADALIALIKKRLKNTAIIGWLCRIVSEVPTIEAEPVRHGRWVNDLDENGFLCSAWRKCSVCGGLNFSKRPPYCPNCGAKMDGDSHD